MGFASFRQLLSSPTFALRVVFGAEKIFKWPWRELQLDQFWHSRLKADGRSGVQWQKVLALLVVNRLVAPGSEFRLHRQWFNGSAMDELLQVDASVASKDRLYRCLDRIMEHRSDLFQHLQQR